MKVGGHIKKTERMLKSISKLDEEGDYELIVEAYLLMAAHYINAAMHKVGVLPEDRDIKHNRLAGFLKKEYPLERGGEELSNLMLLIENLRPSHVYGRGENGKAARRAREAFEIIKEICEGIL
jgi:HEPN domain-containing protein